MFVRRFLITTTTALQHFALLLLSAITARRKRDPLRSFFVLSCMRFVYITLWAARCSDFINLIVYTLSSGFFALSLV